MSREPSAAEHQDRVARVRSVPCPQCKAPAGKTCRSPKGAATSFHHQDRYAALYGLKREGS